MHTVSRLLGVVLSCSVLEAQDGAGSDLTDVTRRLDERRRTQVDQPFSQSVIVLNGKYAEALDRQRQAAQKLGHLDEALALQAERELVIAGKPVPESDDAKTPASLKNLRKTYRISYQVFEKDRLNNLKAYERAYVEALTALKLALTKAGKLGEARAVDERLAVIEKGDHKAQAPVGVESVPDLKLSDNLDLNPSDYFKGAVGRDLRSAMSRAQSQGKPVWIIAAAPNKDDKRTPHLRVHYFMERNETKELVKENFVQVMVPFGAEALRPFITKDDNTETAMLIILSKSGQLVKKLVLNHNGDDGLQKTKEYVELARQSR